MEMNMEVSTAGCCGGITFVKLDVANQLGISQREAAEKIESILKNQGVDKGDFISVLFEKGKVVICTKVGVIRCSKDFSNPSPLSSDK